MYERFTDRARKIMALANQEAQRFNHEYIDTFHILLGLVKEGSGVGADTLKELNVDLRKIRLEVEKLVKAGPDIVTMGKLPQTPRAKKVIEYAIEEHRNLNHNYVGSEHLLLGLIREHDGVAAQVLFYLGLKLEEVRATILDILSKAEEGEDSSRAGVSERAQEILAEIEETRQKPYVPQIRRDLNALRELMLMILIRTSAENRQAVSATLHRLADSISSIPNDTTRQG